MPGLVTLLTTGDDQGRWEAAKALSEIHRRSGTPAAAASPV